MIQNLRNAIRTRVPVAVPSRLIETSPAAIKIPPLMNHDGLTFIDMSSVDPSAKYIYNGGIVRKDADTLRLFYRRGVEPKMMCDMIATCLLANDYTPVEGSHKIVYTHSDAKLIAQNDGHSFEIHGVIRDGEHCEDPRAILHSGAWFVTYTDGYRIGVAKLDLETCETLYTHYLMPSKVIKNTESDGREKNWIPFSDGDSIMMLYSDTPRTILRFRDTGSTLEMHPIHSLGPHTLSNVGKIRGGAPPVPYDEEHMIWFFHTAKSLKYNMGAYVTKGYDMVVKVIDVPILEGMVWNGERPPRTIIKDNVVYPCGAITTPAGWDVSIGICDYKLAILHVPRSLLAPLVDLPSTRVVEFDVPLLD